MQHTFNFAGKNLLTVKHKTTSLCAAAAKRGLFD